MPSSSLTRKFWPIWCCGLLFAASTCFAQLYTVTDLGVLTSPKGINAGGQVVGNLDGHAFLWTNSSGIQDLGTLAGGSFSSPAAVNGPGTVVGVADGPATVVSSNGRSYTCADVLQGFGWTQTDGMQGFGLMLIGGANPCMEPGTSMVAYATGINDWGVVVGTIDWGTNTYVVAFGRNGVIWTQSGGMYPLPYPSNLRLVYPLTEANAINNNGQIVGAVGCCVTLNLGHALFWDSNGTVDLGTLGGPDTTFSDYCSDAVGINGPGQIVGWSTTVPSPSGSPCDYAELSVPHAFMWTRGRGMQDLGTLPGDTVSIARGINYYGQVIGTSGSSVTRDYFPFPGQDPYSNILDIAVVGQSFVWSEGAGMQGLNNLISPNSQWVLQTATGINASGQIVGEGTLDGQPHGFLLTPIYKAFVRPPINADGSSVFKATRGVVPVKFTLRQNDLPTCSLPPATIGVTRTAGGTVGSLAESTYLTSADRGSDFRGAGCQYIYNLGASGLGVGRYRVDISIDGVYIGHAAFSLR